MEGKRFCSNSRLEVGLAWSNGGRDYMQDAFCVVLNHEKGEKVDFLGVFDGHGTNGEDVSRFVAANLCDIVMAKSEDEADFGRAIVDGCLELDDVIRNEESLKDKTTRRVRGGSTSLTAWFKEDLVYCANIGDSRMVISVGGCETAAVTRDHKPHLTEERDRIRKAGGFVSEDGPQPRINDYLAEARSFGDFAFKEAPQLSPEEQMVTAAPQVTVLGRQVVKAIDFMIMASDGVWDVMSNEEVVSFVRNGLNSEGRRLEDVAERLVAKLKSEGGDKQDNVTVLIAVKKL